MTTTLATYGDSLRMLAELFDEHPDLPAGIECAILADDDEAGIAEARRIADILGTEATFNGHSWGTHRHFGVISYRVFYVPRQRMVEHDELMSYAPSFHRGGAA